MPVQQISAQLFGGTRVKKGPKAKKGTKPIKAGTQALGRKQAPSRGSGTQRLGGVGYKRYDGDSLWLPKTERPEWLDGSLPGDRGFDPLSLGKPREYLQFELDGQDINAPKNEFGEISGAYDVDPEELTGNTLSPYGDTFGLQRFRECELQHGRWAMLACLGILVAESTTGVAW